MLTPDQYQLVRTLFRQILNASDLERKQCLAQEELDPVVRAELKALLDCDVPTGFLNDDQAHKVVEKLLTPPHEL